MYFLSLQLMFTYAGLENGLVSRYEYCSFGTRLEGELPRCPAICI